MTTSLADERSGLLSRDDAVVNSHGTTDSNNNSHAQHHHGSARHISEKVPLYARPRQRQRWDESQVLPHVNWGDLYFDLFYVAAAYNLSHAFKDSPNGEGFLYFLTAYLPVFQIWNEKLVYDSRYCPDDNLFHRSLEVFHLCILGTGIWNIQPCYIMSNTVDNPTMMIFAGSLMVDAAFYGYLYIDIYRNVQGGPEARNQAWLEVKRKLLRTIILGTAFAIAARDYFWMDSSKATANHWPAYLIVSEFLFEFVAYNLFEVFVYIPQTGRSHKEFYVPVNLEFLIHRIGGGWCTELLAGLCLTLIFVTHSSPLFAFSRMGNVDAWRKRAEHSYHQRHRHLAILDIFLLRFVNHYNVPVPLFPFAAFASQGSCNATQPIWRICLGLHAHGLFGIVDFGRLFVQDDVVARRNRGGI